MITANKKKMLIALDYDPTALKVAEVGFTISVGRKMNFQIAFAIHQNGYFGMNL
jgi:hypothetical protein